MFNNVYKESRVLITGHTGFKGSWLTEWLLNLGAKVTGFSLNTPTDPSLFDRLGLEKKVTNVVGDICDFDLVLRTIKQNEFDFVFHLAAQPLVRDSYKRPRETYLTNMVGTLNLLESLRLCDYPSSVVIVTTDKCYENKEWVHSYRENDPMGGYDPYSSSKGATELLVSAYRNSFFKDFQRVNVASARAGNVIGGGDWAADRIIPDCIRSIEENQPVVVRNKHATRPWQHVLEPLSGYLVLGSELHKLSGEKDQELKRRICSAFNFGPSISSNRSVECLVTEVFKNWKGDWNDQSESNAPHEASLLNLSTDKAHHILSWQPVWDFETTIARTVFWYKQNATCNQDELRALTQVQINDYCESASIKGISWTH